MNVLLENNLNKNDQNKILTKELIESLKAIVASFFDLKTGRCDPVELQ